MEMTYGSETLRSRNNRVLEFINKKTSVDNRGFFVFRMSRSELVSTAIHLIYSTIGINTSAVH